MAIYHTVSDVPPEIEAALQATMAMGNPGFDPVATLILHPDSQKTPTMPVLVRRGHLNSSAVLLALEFAKQGHRVLLSFEDQSDADEALMEA